MNQPVVQTDNRDLISIENALIKGDLAGLKPEERIAYYNKVCDSLGLNVLTKPFDFISYNGKTILYARKDATEQLRNLHRVSLTLSDFKVLGDILIVNAIAIDKFNRTDSATGAVNIKGLSGDMLANAYMKCETKAKRRVTLSICGLGVLDETEIDEAPLKDVGAPTIKVGQIVQPVDAEAPQIDLTEKLPEDVVTQLSDKSIQTDAKSNPDDIAKDNAKSNVPDADGFITEPKKPFIKTKTKPSLNDMMKERAGDAIVDCWKAFADYKIKDIPEEDLLKMLGDLDIKAKSGAKFPDVWVTFYSNACIYLNRKKELE